MAKEYEVDQDTYVEIWLMVGEKKFKPMYVSLGKIQELANAIEQFKKDNPEESFEISFTPHGGGETATGWDAWVNIVAGTIPIGRN